MNKKILFLILMFGMIFLIGNVSAVDYEIGDNESAYSDSGTGDTFDGIITLYANVTGFHSAIGHLSGRSDGLMMFFINQSGVNLASKTNSVTTTFGYTNFSYADYSAPIEEGEYTLEYHRTVGDVAISRGTSSYSGTFFSWTAQTVVPHKYSGVTFTYTELIVNENETTTNVSLYTPANNSIINTNETYFLSNYSMSGQDNGWNWTNATYNVWFSNGTLFNSTLVDTSGNGNETSYSLLISSLTIGTYYWNVYGCYANATYSNCTWSNNGNYTFQSRPFSLDSQTYTSSVYETSYQTYTANITTLSSILTVTSKLVYNGTELKTATTTCEDENCYIESSFDVPLIDGESENTTSYWNITVFDGDNSYSFSTSSNSFVQNVTRIHLEKCDATYDVQTLNFTAWEEQNLTRIQNFYFAGTFNTWLGSGSVYRNQSFLNASAQSFQLCLTPNNTQFTDAQIEYAWENTNSTYIPRNYYFQNASLTNTSQDIRLYLLPAEDSTTFIIKVQDQKLAAVEEALIYIQRYYPQDGTFKTVQIAKSDSNGETVGFYEAETADYKHIIIKNGETLLNDPQKKVVGKEVPFTLTFTIGDALDYPWNVFQGNGNITTSLTYNKTTKIVTFSYVDSTGSTTSGRLTVLKLYKNNETEIVICNSSSSESSATITCNMSAYDDGNFIAYGYIETEVSNVLDFILSTARDIFEKAGLFIGFILILTAGFAFIWNPVAGIVGVESTIILVNLIGLVSFSPVFIFASIAISILALILLRS